MRVETHTSDEDTISVEMSREEFTKLYHELDKLTDDSFYDQGIIFTLFAAMDEVAADTINN